MSAPPEKVVDLPTRARGGILRATMREVAHLLVGSLILRPYVFGLLAIYLLAAIAEWGWRRAAAFTGLAWALAFLAEWSSTRVGVPFGLYHYTGITRDQELYLANVPFFDSLSFAFLAYAALGVARCLVTRRNRSAGGGRGGGLVLAVTTGVVMMWLDLVVDPLAVRGDRWFLGRIFSYPDPGLYFGVPVANFIGWAVLGTVITSLWLALAPRIGGTPPAWGSRVPGRPYHAIALYYVILAFNLVLTAVVAEPALFWAGVAAHAPLALIVVFCAVSSDFRVDAGAPASETEV